MKEAVKELLAEDSLKLPTPEAQKVLRCAEGFNDWLVSNPELANLFSHRLITLIEGCFQFGRSRKAQSKRERMWEKVLKLSTSPEFYSEWKTQLSSIGLPPYSKFFQRVSDMLVNNIMKEKFPVSPTEEETTAVDTLTYEEKNGLRYTAGAAIRALLKKLTKHPDDSKELVLCLNEMVEGDKGAHPIRNACADNSDILYTFIGECDCASKEWLHAIDRGGLKHVTDDVFMFFFTMELELRKHLELAPDSQNIPSTTIDIVLASDNVLVSWDVVAVNWEREVADKLPRLLLEHHLTVRKHSQASSYMETYKQEHKKTLQKSAAMRKTLIPRSTSSTSDEKD